MDNELQYMLGHSLLRPFVFVLKPRFICLHTDSKRREQEAGNQKAETSATEWLTSPAGWVLCVGAEVLDGHIAGSHWFLLSAHLHRPPVVEGRTCLQNRFVSDSQKWMLQKEKKRKEKGAKTCVTHHHFSLVCPDWCSEPLVWLELHRLSGAIDLHHPVVWGRRGWRQGRQEVVKTENENKRDFHWEPLTTVISCGNADLRLWDGWKTFVPEGRTISNNIFNTPVTDTKTKTPFVLHHLSGNCSVKSAFKSISHKM